MFFSLFILQREKKSKKALAVHGSSVRTVSLRYHEKRVAETCVQRRYETSFSRRSTV